MTSRRQREEWTAVVRGHATDLGGRVAGVARRYWTPAVRRRARVAAWVVFGCLVVPTAICAVMATWYTWRAHHLGGVPVKHRAVRWEGQPVYRSNGGDDAIVPKTAITEDQLRAWEENDPEATRWARRGAASTPTFFLAVLLVRWLTRPPPSGEPAVRPRVV